MTYGVQNHVFIYWFNIFKTTVLIIQTKLTTKEASRRSEGIQNLLIILPGMLELGEVGGMSYYLLKKKCLRGSQSTVKRAGQLNATPGPC